MNESFHEAFSFCNITKNFGSLRANDNVSFSVLNGGIHGVVGENGAGKSTLLRQMIKHYFNDSDFYYINFEDERFSCPTVSPPLSCLSLSPFSSAYKLSLFLQLT